MGLNGPSGGSGEEAKGQPRAPPPQVRIGQGGGAPPPLSFPPLSPSCPFLLQHGREGVLLPVGVGLLLAGRTSPLAPLYTGAGGTLETQQLI